MEDVDDVGDVVVVDDVVDVDGVEEVEEARDTEATSRVADTVLLFVVASRVAVWTFAVIWYLPADVPTGMVRLVTIVIVVWAGKVPCEIVARRDDDVEVKD